MIHLEVQLDLAIGAAFPLAIVVVTPRAGKKARALATDVLKILFARLPRS